MPEYIIHKHTHYPRGLPGPSERALPLLAEGGRSMRAGSTLDDRSFLGCGNRRRGFGAEAPTQARAGRAVGPGGREMRPRIVHRWPIRSPNTRTVKDTRPVAAATVPRPQGSNSRAMHTEDLCNAKGVRSRG
ncbi:hypothetical protein MRX96_012567 [Rhipicephalus microplus]